MCNIYYFQGIQIIIIMESNPSLDFRNESFVIGGLQPGPTVTPHEVPATPG